MVGIVACMSIREGCIPPVLDEGPGFSVSSSCDGLLKFGAFLCKLVCLFIAFDPIVGWNPLKHNGCMLGEGRELVLQFHKAWIRINCIEGL